MFSSRRGTVRHFHFQEISPKKFMPRNDGDKFSFWHKPFRVLGEQSTSSTWIWNKWFQAKRRLKIGVFIIVQGDFPPNKCPPCKIMETSKRSHCFREDKAGIQKRSEEGKRPKKKHMRQYSFFWKTNSFIWRSDGNYSLLAACLTPFMWLSESLCFLIAFTCAQVSFVDLAGKFFNVTR